MSHDPQQQQHQPPYPPQPHRPPLTHHVSAQYQHQPYYGPPRPGWQAPPPRKKSRLGWILGGTALAVTLLCVLAFAGCSAIAREINGGGGSQEEKARDMMARADNVPEDDWVEVFRNNPKVDPGCLSIDTSCLRLSAGWSVDHKVSLEETANRFGMKSEEVGPALGRYVGCIEKEFDGVSGESLCIDESPEGSDSYKVSIRMQRD